MTHHEQLDNIREEMLLQEKDSQSREVKEKTLFFLMKERNYKSGKLTRVISIPKYQVDKEYLIEILEQLGYSNPQYKEDYDGYYEATCYIITL